MILFVCAHADDESLFAGGTIAQMVNSGCSVAVAVLSDGVGSKFDDENDPQYLPARARRFDHFQAAQKALGFGYYSWADVFPDQKSDAVPQKAINDHVAMLVETYQPSIVYTHHVGDLNLDHRRVAEAVLVATRGGPPVFSMAPEWPSRCIGAKWEPNVLRDIWETLDRKVKACACYVDEMRPYPHPRSERAIREQPVEQFMEIP